MLKYAAAKLVNVKGFWPFTFITMLGLVLGYLGPYLNGKFLDFLLMNQSERGAILLALLVASIGMGSAILSYCAGVISIRVTTRLSFSILRETVLHFEKSDYLESCKTDSSYTTQRIVADSNTIASFVLNNYINAPMSVMVIPIIVLVIWSVDSLLAVMSVLLLVLYLCVINQLRERLYGALYQKKEADSKYYSLISSQLSQHLNIQACSLYEASDKSLTKGLGRYLPVVLNSGKLTYALSTVDGLFVSVFQAIVLIISGIRIINGSMTIGEYTIAGAYFGILFKILKSLLLLSKSYQDAKASWDRTAAVINGIDNETLKMSNNKFCSLDSISLSNVDFVIPTLEGKQRNVLHGFTYEFSRPCTYCIAGENGAGKTSLLNLLIGIYKPINGMVKLNGIPMCGCDIEFIRSIAMSFCPQNCVAVDEKVEDFLVFLGTPYEIHAEKMDCVPSLNTSVAALLRKQCSMLSGGELRRVYLWSALARTSSVLLLDEPTTGLDSDGRNELAAYIKENAHGQMIITISHDDLMIQASEVLVRI